MPTPVPTAVIPTPPITLYMARIHVEPKKSVDDSDRFFDFKPLKVRPAVN